MCELFAMSSRFPTDVRISLEEFSRHGGLTGSHRDGWGIAWYVDEDVQLVREPEPAAGSACVRLFNEHPIVAGIVVSHIRKATRGARIVKNCQPFARELGGRMHVFAHNGDLDIERLGARLGSFRPVGDTDSERAFCALLERLRAAWLRDAAPTLDERLAIVTDFAGELRRLGPANFIYSDGDALFVHGHKRFHEDGRGPEPPGLHVLCRRCSGRDDAVRTEGLTVAVGPEQRVVLAASVPLTAESGWRALGEGEIVVARQGRIVRPSATGDEPGR